MDRWIWFLDNLETGRLRMDPELRRRAEDEHRIESVACQVRSLRKAQHMSQVQLAKHVGSTQASISRFESGKVHDVGFLFVRRMLDALGAP